MSAVKKYLQRFDFIWVMNEDTKAEVGLLNA
jgi:hypothetical protein